MEVRSFETAHGWNGQLILTVVLVTFGSIAMAGRYRSTIQMQLNVNLGWMRGSPVEWWIKVPLCYVSVFNPPNMESRAQMCG
jgi:hypothetical protein